MASSGNTWQKKLMNKARLHHLKVKGVKQRFAIDGQKLEGGERPTVGFHRHRKTYGSVVRARNITAN